MLGRAGPARMGRSESRQGQVADRMLHRSRNADQHGKAGKPDVGLRHIDARGRLVIKLARLGIEIPFPGFVEKGQRVGDVQARLFRVEGVGNGVIAPDIVVPRRSEEHTSELQSLMRISYAVFCLKKKILTYMINNYQKNNSTESKSNDTHDYKPNTEHSCTP